MELKIKKLDEDLSIPAYSREGDAALDCYSRVNATLYPGKAQKIPLGFSCAIPEDHVGLLSMRSGMSKRGLMLANAPGIIDSNYRGQVCALIVNITKKSLTIERGQRIVQLLVLQAPYVKTRIVSVLEDTNRGEAGFGSSGEF